ncbi:unnamed protein product [Didymodactylos carnosus]|uniref:Peptidase metallopeptidase domain-containing protein n=1 Tax=Didymodactylos carnosus TaxID=1234261 RepID=A0A813NTE9_9BILA|nr:unnamed protein product [Didymodactylos carnosus]CAF3522947.1 unnamed protein product [Didymodactylos carnosus]
MYRGLVDGDKMSKFLRRFGYVRNIAKLQSNSKSSTNITEGLKTFQRYIGINATGTVDDLTWITMIKPRCGNKDIRIQRRKRFILQGSRWPSRGLSFRIIKYPTAFPRQFVEIELSKALRLWSDASSLTFEHRKKRDKFTDRETDIQISFEIGDHGDTEPFDGPGNVLGHAFFPQYGGDAHFDNDEYWTTKSLEGVNLFQVAAHEFGHSLGLEHSNDPEAIMAPCNNVYRRTRFGFDSDYPKNIRDLFGRWEGGVWQSIPDNLDTALSWSNDQTYFFKGMYYWKTIRFTLQPGYPRKISEGFIGLDESKFFTGNLDAAFVYSGDQKTYFISGALFWRLNENREFRGQIEHDYPQFVINWLRITNKITDALQWINGKTYFFSSNVYYRYDHVRQKVEDVNPPFPRLISDWWLNCNQTNSNHDSTFSDIPYITKLYTRPRRYVVESERNRCRKECVGLCFRIIPFLLLVSVMFH